MNLTAAALVVSLAANAALGYAYLGQRDAAVAAGVKTEQATGAAVACSSGVDDLQKQAASRHAAAVPKIEAAKVAADLGNRKADVILSTPAAIPGDDCKSAQARVDTWWEAREKR